jgi:hypothetical protein
VIDEGFLGEKNKWFFLGIYRNLFGRINLGSPVAQVDREDEQSEDSHLAVKSSCRGRVNGWLPLYINDVRFFSSYFFSFYFCFDVDSFTN